MSKRRAPWAPAPWDHAGQCKAITENYYREAFGDPPYNHHPVSAGQLANLMAAPKLNQGAAA